MQITISKDEACWVCGKKSGNITLHHTIPQHLKPAKNVVVPVCKKCHADINATDLRGMYNFTHKIAMTLKGCQKQLEALQKLLEENERKRVENGNKETQ